MEVSGQFHAPVALPQGKISLYPFDRRLRGPESRSGYGGEEEEFLPLSGIKSHLSSPWLSYYTD
jgi:hypothetical protein